MEINLLLTAKRLELTEQLIHSETAGGIMVIKNVPARTYLAVTTKQWRLLQLFRQPHTVPRLLETIIEERQCPPLGEYYELILKAVRAGVLVEAGHSSTVVAATNWSVALRPQKLRFAIWTLLLVGLVLTVALRPVLPASALQAAISLAIMVVAYVLGTAFAASMLRGAGGEVYPTRRNWIDLVDVCMLPPADQRVILLGPVTVMAAATGVVTWRDPEWSFFPFVALMFQLRPVLRGAVGRIFRAAADPRTSDAEHAFLFPPNRTPGQRWRMLWASLASLTTWKEIGYGIGWTIALGYFVGVLTDVPPWTLAFWQTRGPWLLASLVGSLVLLNAIYLGSEFYLYARERAIARHETLRQFHRRWFKRKKLATTSEARMRAVVRAPLFRHLSLPIQNDIAELMRPHTLGPWRLLQPADEPMTHVSLILSGKVGVYRTSRTGRRALVQVLNEDEVVGLHAAADPSDPNFVYRTLTPVVLLQLEWEQAEQLILSQTSKDMLINLVQKLPFLARIRLCQNWHMQAIQRFAELSLIQDFRANEVMLQEGDYSKSFFILMEGDARVTKRGKLYNRMNSGSFFGEIGLLQNSRANAQVTAGEGARILSIQRRDFLRFVAHNYSVALELERVSSRRLGRPIFPLSPENFETI